MLKIKIFFRQFLQIIKYCRDYVNGDFAYQQYLQRHHQKTCAIISKKEFLNQQRHAKWNNVNRCC